MTIPKYQELFHPVLKTLSDEKEHNIHQIVKTISDELNLTEEEINERLASGQTIISVRVNWATTYLKKAGLIERKKRGYRNITEEGLKSLNENHKITEEYLYKYPEFVEFIGRTEPPTPRKPKIPLTPQEEMNIAYTKINQDLADNLLETIKEQSPQFFEKLVVDLLLKMGYGGFKENAGNVTKFTGDGGIDGIIDEDILGLGKIGIQAKKYANNKIGTQDIDKFIGALVKKGLKKGVFITTSSFTDNAIDEAENQTNPNIILIDGEKLSNLMIEYELGAFTNNIYKIKKINMDYFNEDP